MAARVRHDAVVDVAMGFITGRCAYDVLSAGSRSVVIGWAAARRMRGRARSSASGERLMEACRTVGGEVGSLPFSGDAARTWATRGGPSRGDAGSARAGKSPAAHLTAPSAHRHADAAEDLRPLLDALQAFVPERPAARSARRKRAQIVTQSCAPQHAGNLRSEFVGVVILAMSSTCFRWAFSIGRAPANFKR